MDFGSILTSSANGSCSLLAIDTALLSPSLNFGNSSSASLEAEYTDAPASLTMIYSTLVFFIISTTTCSDSLDAVPFPIAITSILYLSINSLTVLMDSDTLFCGAVG